MLHAQMNNRSECFGIFCVPSDTQVSRSGAALPMLADTIDDVSKCEPTKRMDQMAKNKLFIAVCSFLDIPSNIAPYTRRMGKLVLNERNAPTFMRAINILSNYQMNAKALLGRCGHGASY